jgi:hypothetical protein
MKAFGARRPRDSRRSEGEGACEHYIPEVLCDLCGNRWCETEVWYPSLSLAKDSDRAQFVEDASVSPEELKVLRRQIVGMRERKLRLVPGAGIGPVKAAIPKKATDFVWCGFRLLANRAAVESLQDRGIIIPHGPAVVKMQSKRVRSYVALELDSIPLWDETTLKETTVVYCKKCGGYSMQDERASLDGLKRYVRRRMPKNHGLVRVNESYVTLASDAFVEVFTEEGLTGMEFVEEGIYV